MASVLAGGTLTMTLGSPEPEVNKRRPTNLDWLRAHMKYNADECLMWPFSRSRGYATVAVNRKIKKASRVMCEWIHGPPPTPKHEAAHLCGCGHLGCVNPKHLSWKTRSENQQDRKQHGTQGKGRWLRVSSKLTPEQVSQIRAIGSSLTKEELGRQFAVTPAQIARILSRRAWKVDGQYPKRGWAVTPYRRKAAIVLGELTNGEKR